MLKAMKRKMGKTKLTTFILAALAVITIFSHNQRAVAQNPTPGCALIISGQPAGDTDGFIIENYDATTISIQIAEPDTTGWGLWSSTGGGTVALTSSNNANVNITTPADDTKEVVYITASKTDPAQSAGSFAIRATTSYGHYVTFNVEVNCPPATHGCTLTQGFWKNKPNEWPTTTLTLGTMTYNKTQLIAILKTPVKGNGLVSLSHQLIAAKLNFENNAAVPPAVLSAIGIADGQIGALIVPSIGAGYLSPNSTSALTSTLDIYNNGRSPNGPPHCED
jgi:hypothetical protein